MIQIQGKVLAGEIVLDEPLDVPDGTPVTVVLSPRDWLLRFAGIWRDESALLASISESFAARTTSPGREL